MINLPFARAVQIKSLGLGKFLWPIELLMIFSSYPTQDDPIGHATFATYFLVGLCICSTSPMKEIHPPHTLNAYGRTSAALLMPLV